MGFIKNDFEIIDNTVLNDDEGIVIKGKIMKIEQDKSTGHCEIVLSVGCKIIISEAFLNKNKFQKGNIITIKSKEISYDEDMPYIQ